MKVHRAIQEYLFPQQKSIELKNLQLVAWRNRYEVQNFLNKFHYLGATQGWRYAFAVKHHEHIVGCITLGRPVARLEDQKNTLELTRFCLINECPKNSESFVMGKLLKLIKEKGWKRIIAYSDLEVGHRGTIYKATNWKQVGITGGSDWRNRKGRKCSVGKNKKIKWEIKLC